MCFDIFFKCYNYEFLYNLISPHHLRENLAGLDSWQVIVFFPVIISKVVTQDKSQSLIVPDQE